MQSKSKSRFFFDPLVLFTLLLILSMAFFLRVYKLNSLLDFYFDQGRDALVIWDLWHKGKFFLIGPTTGIEGIFRGPFYYYLIAPFYILSSGNPLYPAVFLSTLSTISIFLLFYLGYKISGTATGLIAATLSAFSYHLVVASRWLSNPTPMLLLSLLLLWTMFLISQGKRFAWPILSFLAGLSLFHFGSSGEFFYFPAIAIFAIWQRKYKPTYLQFALSVLLFVFTAAPLIVFDLRHEGILLKNIKEFLIDDSSFKTSIFTVITTRADFYYKAFTKLLFNGIKQRELILLSIIFIYSLFNYKIFIKNTNFKITLLLFLSPIVGLLFFQGNHGNIYDYYLTGYYLVFMLLVSTILGQMFKSTLGKLFVLYFLYVFLFLNITVLGDRLNDNLTNPHSIGFKNQLNAISWIYKDSSQAPFSLDIYVPPVIPYSYDYLFQWYAGSHNFVLPSKDTTDPLYLLYEVDPPHPERLQAWLDRQDSVAKIEKSARFGGITVQKRRRYTN